MNSSHVCTDGCDQNLSSGRTNLRQPGSFQHRGRAGSYCGCCREDQMEGRTRPISLFIHYWLQQITGTRHALVSYRQHDPDSDVLTDLPKVTLLGIRHGRDGQMRVSYNLVCVSTTFMKEGGHFCKLTTKETQATRSTHYCTISLGCFSMQLEVFTCVALHKSMDINASC